jgi:Family of unknown function (DUF6714)
MSTVGKAKLVETIKDAFGSVEAPHVVVRDSAPADEFRADIIEALEFKTWDEVSIPDWRMIGVSMNTIRRYMTDRALAYFLPSLMIGGIAADDTEYALDLLLPDNQRWEPGGPRWDAFIGVFDNPQRDAIRSFLTFVAQTERDGDPLRAAAEHALWKRLYG